MARPPSHSITCLVGAGLAGRSEARASPPYAIEIGSIMQGRTAGDDGLPSTRFTVSTSKAPGRGQVMTGFTVDAVSFRHKFPALSIHLAGGLPPERAHFAPREPSQAGRAGRGSGGCVAAKRAAGPLGNVQPAARSRNSAHSEWLVCAGQQPVLRLSRAGAVRRNAMGQVGQPVRRYIVIPLQEPVSPTAEPVMPRPPSKSHSEAPPVTTPEPEPAQQP